VQTNRSNLNGMGGRPPPEDVKRRVIAAICALYRHDRELLDVDANERSITHKLAEHLQREFPGWHVDCEYNRRGREPKRLEAKTVFPDIIVHRRGNRKNLLVMEVKKDSGRDDSGDVEKLKQFTKDPKYRYEYGLLLKLRHEGLPELKLYRNGEPAGSWTEELRGVLKKLRYRACCTNPANPSDLPSDGPLESDPRIYPN